MPALHKTLAGQTVASALTRKHVSTRDGKSLGSAFSGGAGLLSRARQGQPRLLHRALSARQPGAGGRSCPKPIRFPLRRLKDDTETIRIISARQASRKEREAYAG